jgi:hypothetical protein
VSRGSVCARTSARRLFIARRRRDEFYCLYSIMTALAHFYGRAQRPKILISRVSRFSARSALAIIIIAKARLLILLHGLRTPYQPAEGIRCGGELRDAVWRKTVLILMSRSVSLVRPAGPEMSSSSGVRSRVRAHALF